MKNRIVIFSLVFVAAAALSFAQSHPVYVPFQPGAV